MLVLPYDSMNKHELLSFFIYMKACLWQLIFLWKKSSSGVVELCCVALLEGVSKFVLSCTCTMRDKPYIHTQYSSWPEHPGSPEHPTTDPAGAHSVHLHITGHTCTTLTTGTSLTTSPSSPTTATASDGESCWVKGH